MPGTVYCTIASANYLPQITALVSSIRRTRPGADVRILLCEEPAAVRELAAKLGEPFVAPDAIGCPEWRELAFYYDVMEFNTAVKPWFLETLLRDGADAVVYFDPDILVYGGLEEIEQQAGSHDVILTPHLSDVLDDDGRTPSVLQYNRVGQFNLGFIGFRAGERTRRALRWWQDRCREDCVSDLPSGLFVDQSWANLFASFLDARILRSERFNMAYWNVFQRTLRREGSTWVTGDGPLSFFHFSGLDLRDVEAVSRHQDRLRAPAGTPLREILEEYRGLLEASPVASYRTFPYSFATFRDGTAIPMRLRRRFRALSAIERRELADPFAERTFLESLVELDFRRARGSRLARFAALLHVEPPDRNSPAYDRINTAIKRRFPRLHGAAKEAVGNGVRNTIKRLFP
jgi:hypothetical protein